MLFKYKQIITDMKIRENPLNLRHQCSFNGNR